MSSKETQREYYLKHRGVILQYQKEYRESHKEKSRFHGRSWYLKNKDLQLSRQKQARDQRTPEERLAEQTYQANWRTENAVSKTLYDQKYRKEHRAELRLYFKNKLKTDIQYRLGKNLRERLRKALKNNQQAGHAVRDLGCTVSELKMYLEGQFKDGMTWENWSMTGWHIDHKVPLAFFDLTDRKQLLQAVHYSNLQPLWAKENIAKGKKHYENKIHYC